MHIFDAIIPQYRNALYYLFFMHHAEILQYLIKRQQSSLYWFGDTLLKCQQPFHPNLVHVTQTPLLICMTTTSLLAFQLQYNNRLATFYIFMNKCSTQMPGSFCFIVVALVIIHSSSLCRLIHASFMFF